MSVFNDITLLLYVSHNIIFPNLSMEFEIEEKLLQLNDNTEYSSFEVLNANDLSYSKFFQDFIRSNKPCLIKNVASKWKATSKWVVNGKPNLDYLNEQYKDTKVIIYNCAERYFNSQKCIEGTLGDYLQLLKQQHNNLYYLKDWHLKLQRRADEFYEVPIYFASDWLNEYFTECMDDDYRFVYIGQKETWTPLHADVFNSYSWSVNICGRKKWIFFPPGEEVFLKDSLNNLPYDISQVSHSRKCFEVIQNSGEAIFVPSSWYHQVWNLDDTISINHNWVNGCNINIMWQSLKSNLELTRKEIEHCKEMDNFEEHCQLMLKALVGMDYKMFYGFLTFIGRRRLDMLNCEADTVIYHGHIIGKNHILFDLSQIRNVLEDFLKCDIIGKFSFHNEGHIFLKRVIDAVE